MGEIQKITPAQKQYKEIKKQNSDAILFFRMGDFYETFYEDAHICSKVLDIALIYKDKTNPQPIPMAGIPYHSADKYIPRLIKAGYKIALAEQIGEVKPGQLVAREVVSIITPGTYLDEKKSADTHLIGAVIYSDQQYHLCWGDFSLGEYYTQSFLSLEDLLVFIIKINLIELVIDNELIEKDQIKSYLSQYSKVFLSQFSQPVESNIFLLNILNIQTLDSLGEALKQGRDQASALLFYYLQETQHIIIRNIVKISFAGDEHQVLLDAISIKNLEICKSSYDNSNNYTLIHVLDNTQTPMGSRLLTDYILHPIKNISLINWRLDLIAYFYENLELTHQIIEVLKPINDIPRLLSSILYKKINPFQINKLKNFFRIIFGHYSGDKNYSNISMQNYFFLEELKKIGIKKEVIPNLYQLYLEIENALQDEGFTNELDYIKDGYSSEIDNLRKTAFHSDELLIEYQQELIKLTGINNLKIKFINKQGYFLEVTKKDALILEQNIKVDNEKLEFWRRQTLKNGERYTTTYLETIQEKILNAKNELEKQENLILQSILQQITKYQLDINEISYYISLIDLFTANAIRAYEKKWCKPIFVNENILEIKNGRHPVIEEFLPLDQQFVPNDCIFKSNESIIHLITGPNMGGKSTFLRQNALIILISHAGLRVPASSVKLGVVDAIFARVGSGDILAKNQSTFLTEMIEVANILHNATSASFIILDELGRGTSTYDGVALAKAIVKQLAEKIKAKTLFATHYHELIQFQKIIPQMENFAVAVYETDKEVIFMKKIIPGGISKSYGIDVAQIAGLPIEILNAAKIYLTELESEKKETKIQYMKPLFEINSSNINDQKYTQIKNFLATIDINRITPLQSLEILNKVKKMLE